MQKNYPISRNKALEELSSWIDKHRAAIYNNSELDVFVLEEGNAITMKLANQIFCDPRTKKFVEHQSFDLHYLMGKQRHSDEFMRQWTKAVGAKIKLIRVSMKNSLGEDADFSSSELNKMFSPDVSHVKDMQYYEYANILQSILRTGDEHLLCLMTNLYIDANHRRLKNISKLVKRLFWNARMRKCSKIGHCSSEIITEDITESNGELVSIISNIKEEELNRHNLSFQNVSDAYWERHGTHDWVTTDLTPPKSKFNIKWFGIGATFFLKDGILYGLRHPSLSKFASKIMLTKSSNLLLDCEHDSTKELKLNGDGVYNRSSIPDGAIVEVDSIPSDVLTELNDTYTKEAENAYIETNTLDFDKWVDKYNYKIQVLAGLKLIPENLMNWMDKKFESLSQSEKNTFSGHQFSLLSGTVKAQRKERNGIKKI